MRYLVLFTAVLFLASCAKWHQFDYDKGSPKQTQTVHPIDVTSGVVQTARVREYYPIPDVVHQNQQRSVAQTTPDHKPPESA